MVAALTGAVPHLSSCARGRLDDGVRLLSKPFRKAQLARVLRESLEERFVIPMTSKAAVA